MDLNDILDAMDQGDDPSNNSRSAVVDEAHCLLKDICSKGQCPAPELVEKCTTSMERKELVKLVWLLCKDLWLKVPNQPPSSLQLPTPPTIRHIDRSITETDPRVIMDPLYGLRLRLPTTFDRSRLSTSIPKLSLKDINSFDCSKHEEYVTAAVVNQCSFTKQSAARSNNHYCVWRLTDLSDTQAVLLLFGAAYRQYWKQCPDRMYIFIKNPRVMPPKSEYKSYTCALSVNTADCIEEIGLAIDAVVCSGGRNEPCNNLIDKRCIKQCKYHRSISISVPQRKESFKRKSNVQNPPNQAYRSQQLPSVQALNRSVPLGLQAQKMMKMSPSEVRTNGVKSYDRNDWVYEKQEKCINADILKKKATEGESGAKRQEKFDINSKVFNGVFKKAK
ncbi:hypothetical protein ACOME3_005052 [Neoechinorhynchus agilis]